MRIQVYYGGRGLIGDPTLCVINKMQQVLEELNVTVERFDLYEMKNSITMLPQTLKTADGVILASTVEWYGTGGYMQTFLDACWQYGDKSTISRIYMCPVVMSTTYGEREGKLNLATAWEILGGLPCSGICGYIPEVSALESNPEYHKIIEKKAENLYRTINQKLASFPASNQAVKQKVSLTRNTDLTPQETEQLSVYAADETFVQRQKEDISELTNLYKGLMEQREVEDLSEYTDAFEAVFHAQPGFSATYRVKVSQLLKPLILQVNNASLKCYFGTIETTDIDIQIGKEAFRDIITGRNTFQKSFMNGTMTLKGDFKIMRTLDSLFDFAKQV